jgi:diketogulonate reductase-like aldo/keto reductase
MKVRTLPSGHNVPVLGFGTWRLGGSMTPDTSQDAQVIQALQTAIELGYTHLDTAEMYGGGHTEELVGLAIRGIERSRLQIGTKIWHTNLGYENVFRSLEGSLKRLGTDYVDYYVIHLPSAHIPMEETFRALLDHPLIIDLAAKYGATPAQIALNWLAHHDLVVVYLTSLNRAHLQENIAALELELSPEDHDRLHHIEMPEEKLWPQ